MKILITGGAGFIGSRLALRLLKENYQVTILDNFSEQIHGNNKELPDQLKGNVKLFKGSVTDKSIFYQALEGQDVIVHLAAETGTGQSMYEIERYSNVNIQGTSLLMEYLVNNKKSTIQKVVVASSRAVYGEGKYRCSTHGIVYPNSRKTEDMRNELFDPVCPLCGESCSELLTDEDSSIDPASFYGLTKLMQEKMILMFARSLNISGYALRYQNVYGPGQSLNNPYTGILAIFSKQAKMNKPIYIFEDGKESRDFVYIDDVVEATYRCIKPENKGVDVFNVGSGKKTTVLDVVTAITGFFNSKSDVSINGAFREGDIRHNIADLTRIQGKLGYTPKWDFDAGIVKFLEWAEKQTIDVDKDDYINSLKEMTDKGLMYEK